MQVFAKKDLLVPKRTVGRDKIESKLLTLFVATFSNKTTNFPHFSSPLLAGSYFSKLSLHQLSKGSKFSDFSVRNFKLKSQL